MKINEKFYKCAVNAVQVIVSQWMNIPPSRASGIHQDSVKSFFITDE